LNSVTRTNSPRLWRPNSYQKHQAYEETKKRTIIQSTTYDDNWRDLNR